MRAAKILVRTCAYAGSHESYCLWPCSLAITSTGRVGFYGSGAHEGSTGSGSDFKASQKTGHGLKSRPTDWEKPGIEPVTPSLQDSMLAVAIITKILMCWPMYKQL